MNRVGIIGFPVGHSLSPIMHNAAFAALDMTDWHYDAMEIPPDIVRYGVLEPKRHGYIGLNVTVPHKQAVLHLVDPDEKARAIGAVNTIDFRDDSGTNTDVDGFIEDLKAHHVAIKDAKIVVLGAGGAARAAVYGLAREGAQVAVVNRALKRAQELVLDMKALAGINTVEIMSIDDAVDWEPSLIVNCTPVGMMPHADMSPWPENLPFPQKLTVYDMVYRPAKTLLMRQTEGCGGYAIGGLGMLVRQGAASFEIWTGRKAPLAVMFDAAQNALKGKTE